ncbi:MAG TPA: chromosome segregation protein SMC [Clostridia bacterium]|nr:chromosome segregation protein SMC [Clostridia bacterium]
MKKQVYLKRLEIQGFKSFADKTNLEFKPGITLVVGPNGSGKSNIADAIRWVLGEQSVKSLRGDKMEDVIFAGSENRRSLGLAEVSITLDNSSGQFPLDYHEITVTRRLYRSGESDYLINRVPCRLRDIHELFMDTGIGREGFSIIGQGKVDEVLSVKSEERRGLLEEAAGIVKYRYKKRETLKKLEETENSLVRLQDIIQELRMQEEPLAQQAEKAREYRCKKTELDNLEIGMIVEETAHYEQQLVKNAASGRELEMSLEEARAGYHQVQTRQEEYKLELQKKDEELADYQEKIYEENVALEKHESQKQLVSARKADLLQRQEQLAREQEQLQQEAASIRQKLADQEEQEEALLKQLAADQEKLQQYEAKMDEENRREQAERDRIEDLQNEHFELLQKETAVQNDITALKQRMILIQKQEEQFNTRESQMKAEMAAIMEKLADLEKEAQDNSAKLADLEQELVARDQKYLEKREKLKQRQEQNQKLKEEKSNLESRYHVLLEMEKEGQGYGRGVREILQQKEKGLLSGIIGTVAQIIEVPRAYETAVEVVLGGALQHLVTEKEQAARAAIEWLKKNNCGRVTFLPLDTVKGAGKTPVKSAGKEVDAKKEGLSGKGVIGRLSELIQYDQKYKGIMDFLLGRTWLVENLALAVEKAKETGFKYRIVTLDGQTVNPGGSLTGGSAKAVQSSILGRKRNLDELQEKIKALEAALAEGAAQEQALEDAVQEARRQWEEVKEKIQGLRLREVEVSSVLDRWQADRGRQESEVDHLQVQREETAEEKENILASVEKYAQEKLLLEEKKKACLAELEQLQEKVRLCQQEKLKRNEELTQLRIEAATAEARLTSFRKEKNYHEQRLLQLEQELQEKAMEAENSVQKVSELEQAYQEAEKGIATCLRRLRELEAEQGEKREDKLKVQELMDELTAEIKKIAYLLHEKEEKLHQLELQRSKWESSLEAAERRLTEQFQLTLAEAQTREIMLPGNRKKCLERIALLKAELQELGEVNLGAIDEYNRLRERLDFLEKQVNDMTEAKTRLEMVIREMDQIMAKRFKETFEQVNEAFKKVFVELFGGGKAELVLSEPSQLLETGVEIMVQPPGKKTQHLSLLSGGERALTAIALLMAILQVRPSPFCVLDEIESNLDEANVYRFADLLRDFAQKTQFIVISHRKGTMEAADVLYGVTMAETGVSRLVSVKLEDAQKDAS